MKVAIIDYGSGNIRSVQFALERMGIEVVCTPDKEKISKADKVILPGVGTAQNVMRALKERDLDRFIPRLKQAVLGICVGMQVMCSYSEEGDTPCLGIFPQDVLHFGPGGKVPHMGWNTIQNFRSPLLAGLQENSYVYFVHSYYVPVGEFSIATSHYQTAFSSLLKKDNFYAAQFHPEKSGETGLRILHNFLFNT